MWILSFVSIPPILQIKGGSHERRRVGRIRWLKEFGHYVCIRKTIYEISVRDVVIYFAEWAEKFEDPGEWYDRYKVLERFFDDLVDMRHLDSNQIKGIYDDTDFEPDLTDDEGPFESLEPVNWLRKTIPFTNYLFPTVK